MEDVSEPDTTSFKCLFCEQQCSPVNQMFAHVESDHKFPITEKIKAIGSGSTFLLPISTPLIDSRRT